MGNDDVTKRFKPVWNLPLALDRNIDHKGETDYAGAMSQLSNGKYSATDIRDSGKPH